MGEPRSLDKAEATGGYTWIENRLIEEFLPSLSGLAFKVYVHLARNAPQGRNHDPITRKGLSASRIGKALCRSRRSVTKSLQELDKLGLVEKIKHPGVANRYRLLATCEENFPGDGKISSQGREENCTPPEKKTSQFSGADQHGARVGGSPKSSLREYKRFKETSKRRGLRPAKSPSGCGPRRV